MSSLFFNQQQQQFFSSVMKLFKVKAVVISHKLRQKKANDSWSEMKESENERGRLSVIELERGRPVANIIKSQQS